MFYKLIVSIILISGAKALTPVKQCAGNILLPSVIFGDETDNTACDKMPCPTIKGHTVYGALNFTSPKYFEKLKQTITVVQFGFDYMNDDKACDYFTNTPCPVMEKERVSYRFTFSLMEFLPSISLTLRFTLTDITSGLNDPIACFEIDIVVP